MNRRQFLGKSSAAVVSTLVAAHLPTTWLPQPVQRLAAIQFLREEWMSVTDGAKGWWPKSGYVGEELFAAYRKELLANLRIGANGLADDEKVLAFKMAYIRPRGPGWWVVFDTTTRPHGGDSIRAAQWNGGKS